MTRPGELFALEGIHAPESGSNHHSGEMTVRIYVSVRTRVTNETVTHPRLRLMRRIFAGSDFGIA